MILKAKILIFCTIFVVCGVFAQKIEGFGHTNPVFAIKKATLNLSYNNNFVEAGLYVAKNYLKQYNPLTKEDQVFRGPALYSTKFPVQLISPDYYTQNFGFFCKKEMQLQKAIKMPFVFRLGSVEICDRLEGKLR